MGNARERAPASLDCPFVIQCYVVNFLADEDRAHYRVVSRACRGVALLIWLPPKVAKFADIQIMMRWRDRGVRKLHYDYPPLCCICHDSVLRWRQWGQPGAHPCPACGFFVCAACQCQCKCVGLQCVLPKDDDVIACSRCCAWCHTKCGGASACKRCAVQMCARPARTCDDVTHARASSVGYARMTNS
jgi:hypothetical protein